MPVMRFCLPKLMGMLSQFDEASWLKQSLRSHWNIGLRMKLFCRNNADNDEE